MARFAPRGSRLGACRAALTAVAALWLIAGCAPETPERAELRVEVSGCIGPVEGDPAEQGLTCRARLVEMSGPGASACLLLTRVDVDNAPVERSAWMWSGARLVPANDDVTFDREGTIRAALFFLDRGAAAVDPCDAFGLDTPCRETAGCALKLGPETRQLSGAGVTRLSFFDDADGSCRAESSSADGGQFIEVCDGVDNNCDGQVDEPRFAGCTHGLGACEARGAQSVCRDGQYVCDAPLISPAASDADCNGQDDDCDGAVDEDADCNECLFDNECQEPGLPQCVAARCRACDPADGAGCPPETPLCDRQMFTCRACAADAECGPDRHCVNNRCGDCDPADADSCPDAQRAVCDLEALTCRACQSGDECQSGYCFNGRCATCQPVTNNGCEGATPVCDANTQTCRACAQNAECALIDRARPVCADDVCVACSVGDNTGCTDPTAPICADDGAGPACGPCTANGECSTGTCRVGRCIGCNPDTHQGCNDAQPICDGSDPAEPFCRACQASPECSQPGRRVCTGGRCEECDDGTQDGCAVDGPTPICAGSQCRACIGDGECAVRDGPLDYCVAGHCRPCDPDSDAGCAGNTPICDPVEATCRRCADDGECGAEQCLGTGRCARCDPEENAGCPADNPICVDGGDRCRACEDDGECGPIRQCVAGRCVGCNPGTNEGCDAAGVAPICDGPTASCRGCRNDDECGEGQCLADGRCAECDPDTGVGCDPESVAPLCGQDGACRGCNGDNECVERGLGNLCSAGQCIVCEVNTNVGCDGATPICEDGAQCRRCNGDQECGAGRFCSGGNCTGCVPGTVTGCDPDGDTPFCDVITAACRGCREANECFGLNRSYCIDGACLACEPATGNGCIDDSDRPICSPGGACVPCETDEECDAQVGPGIQCSDGRCGDCDPAEPASCPPNLPVCDPGTLTCGPCAGDESCPLGNCIGGACVTCASYDDCEAGGDRPFCDPATQRCRACAGDAECDGNLNGLVCRDGRCGCTFDDFQTCVIGSRRPVCSLISGTCRGCSQDGECRGHPLGEQCTPSNRCRPCNANSFANNNGQAVYDGCDRDAGICFPPGDACAVECDPDAPNCPAGESCESNSNGHFGCR